MRRSCDVARWRPDRFLPHIQPYEFEALLFSDTSHFAREQPEWEQRSEELAAARREAASPEHINDGPDTHPSARLERLCRLPQGSPRYGPCKSASGWTASADECASLCWVALSARIASRPGVVRCRSCDGVHGGGSRPRLVPGARLPRRGRPGHVARTTLAALSPAREPCGRGTDERRSRRVHCAASTPNCRTKRSTMRIAQAD